MSHFLITGGVPLRGMAGAGGSKNASLPMMAAAILADGPVQLDGVPDLTDVRIMGRLLRDLGVAVSWTGEKMGTGSERSEVPVPFFSPVPLFSPSGGDVRLETIDPRPVRASYRLVRRMRAGFCVLGPLLARRGAAMVPLPGGCNIGDRPVDLHLRGLAALGADLRLDRGYIVASARRLTGTTIDLRGPRGPTVTGTANVLSAAVLARGTTTIRGAATEPEVVDLGNFLIAMGARIAGLGTATVEIAGVQRLGGARYRVIPDRIEAATLLLAAAITGGAATVTGVIPDHLGAVLEKLRAAGARVDVGPDEVTITADGRPRPVDIVAEPYPGIPTDVQAQWTALMTLASGVSTVEDRVFPARFRHAAELNRLGAQIDCSGPRASVTGVRALSAAGVTASDLRASAALVLAALAAEGTTVVDAIHHLDRGYERLDRKLARLGAQIRRVDRLA